MSDLSPGGTQIDVEVEETNSVKGEERSVASSAKGEDANSYAVDSAEESEEQAKQIAEIVERENKDSFPLVPSHCQCSVNQLVADELSAWVLKTNYVKFQTFLDACYSTYRELHPLPSSANPTLTRLSFMRDVYYTKLSEWRDSGEDLITLMEELRDLIQYEKADVVDQKKIDNAFTSMWPTRIKSFHSFVLQRWESVTLTLPAFARQGSAAQKSVWFRTELDNLMSLFMQDKNINVDTWKKVLEWLGADIRNCEPLSTVEKFFFSFKKEIDEKIVDELQGAFTEATTNLPGFMLKNLPRAKLEWFLECYVSAIEAYVSGERLKSKRTLWENVHEWLDLTENICADVGEAKAYLEAMCESTCPSYTADREKEFDSMWQALPSFAQKNKAASKVQWFFNSFAEHRPCIQNAPAANPNETRTTAFLGIVGGWLENPSGFTQLIKEGQVQVDSTQLDGLEFSSVAGKLDVMFSRVLEKLPSYLKQDQKKTKLEWLLVEQKSIFASLSSESEPIRQMESASTATRTNDVTLQFVSPRKKARITNYESRDVKLADIYAEDLQGGNALTVTGYVVDIDEEVREVDTWDHLNKVHVKKGVVNCTLVDETGVAARIDFWGDLAENTHKQLQHEVAREPVGVCFTFLAVQKEDKSVRPYKKLSATNKTTFSNADPAKPDQSGSRISDKLFVSNFDQLIVAMPYVANVKGVVAVCETTISATGVEMKHFELVDAKSNSVEVTAYGRHGGNELLSVGNEVIIFIASALIKDGAPHGHLWVYDRAHVVLRRANVTVPMNRKLLYLVRK